MSSVSARDQRVSGSSYPCEDKSTVPELGSLDPNLDQDLWFAATQVLSWTLGSQ